MNKDLQIIKKKYGENMSRLCRELYPRILETEGLLPSLLLDNFEPSHQLYNDIVDNDLINEFKDYIYSLVDIEKIDNFDSEKTPEELLYEAGYILYECKSEKEIQRFKKYYAKDEELCTFNGGRLNRCRVFFAVKKDVDQIKREDFTNPKRQDEYGTSVISIQFTKDRTNTLSIKNRYNHTVDNPDATFSNNLDNIIPGLTIAFEKEYGIVQKNKRKKSFEIPHYVVANDGKYYKYNYELNNKYYCPNNIIIDDFEVKRLEKEKYILLDYFILDLQNKIIVEGRGYREDSFVESIGEIERIEVLNIEEGKEINITPKEGKVIKITLDRENRIIKLTNDNVKEIGDFFLSNNTILKEAELSNVEIIGDCFLDNNKDLERLYAPKLRKIGDEILLINNVLREVDLKSLEEVGSNFLEFNLKLVRLYAPKLRKIGDRFLSLNSVLREVDLKSLEETGIDFLKSNAQLTELSLPSLEIAGDFFLCHNTALVELYAPKLKQKGFGFLHSNPNFENGIKKR